MFSLRPFRLIAASVAALCAGGWPGDLTAVPVRVATYNIENGIAAPGTAKYEAAKEVLARIDADVIAFQELRRNTTTTAWEQNWQQLAAELGYLYAFGPDGTTLSGTHRLGYFSRFPIREVAHVRSPPGANEMSRLPMRMVLEVPGAAKPLVLWNMHHKANEEDQSLLAANQFRRAVEAIRIAQDINAYVAANPDHDEFVVLGDLNADVFSEPQEAFFHTIPSGLPTRYALGADIAFPVAYQFFPDDVYAGAGGGMQRLDAFQAGSTVRHTYPSWPSVLDYVIVSTSLYQGPAGPPVGEVYNSQQDAIFPSAGLPKAGAALAPTVSRTASDHLAVFVDLEMEDELAPGWTVSPETAWAPQGFAGGPFTPAQQAYTLENPLPEAVSWSVQANVPWLQISTLGGTLAGGAAETVLVTIDPVQVPTAPGVYFGALSWQDEDGEGVVTRRVVLSVLQPGRIAVSPAVPALVVGPPGGPFSPATTTYTISNPGQGPVTWTASSDVPWVTLDATSGQLAPGQSVQVTATMNESANVLPLGTRAATLTFGDGNAPGASVTRTLQLEVRVRDYLTQQWSNATELTGRSFTFAPDGSVDQYRVVTEEVSAFPSDPTGGIDLGMQLDDFKAIDLAGGASIPFYGTRYTRVFAGSHGYITFGSGDTQYISTLPNHFNRPRVSALFADLDPSRAGTVSWRQWPDRLAVTYAGVREFERNNVNTFQIELFFDGRIRVTYLRVDAPAAITGLSAGGGVPVDFTASDFLGYPRAADQPWGRTAVSGITTTTAQLITPVLPVDRSAFTAHGYVVARAALQPLPALGDASSGVIDFAGAPPETLAVLVEGLEPDTRHAVRAYAVRDGEPVYSALVEFTTNSAATPYYEAGFEGPGEIKGGYAINNVTISGLVWSFDDALIGSLSGDMKNGSRAARILNGSISMVGFLNQGAGEVRFLYARSNFSGDRSGNAPVFAVEYATAAAPDTWVAIGDPVSLAGVNELTPFAARVDVPGEVRVRIRKVGGDAGKRWNIDDFAVTPFAGVPTGPVVIGTDLEAAGRVGEDFDYVIPVEGQAQFFEMETVPPGLTLDTATGRLAGMPALAGSYELTVVAGNQAGSDSATLLVDIARGLPAVLQPPAATPIFAGQALSASSLSGGEASVPGTFVFGDPSLQPGAGSGLQTALFLPADTLNYEAVALAVTVEVQTERPFAEVSLQGLETVYDGTPRVVAVTTVPAGLAVEVTYNGQTEPPVDAGVYEVVAVVTEEPYLGSASGSLLVNRATPQVSEAPVATALNQGQTLGESVLTGGSADVPGVFVFADGAAVPAPGVQSVQVLFIPTDAGNYTTVSVPVTLVVRQAVTISFGGLAAIHDGLPKPVTVETQPAGVTVRVTYDGIEEIPVAAGSYAVEAMVESELFFGQAGTTLFIAKGTPGVVGPPVVAPLSSGQALSAAVLEGGSASVPGSFAFSLPATVPPDGTTNHAVVFTPEDTANYDAVSFLLAVTVMPVLPDGPVVAAWNLARQPGDQPASPGAGADGVEAISLVRGAGLQAATATGSMIANGWHEGEGNHFAFGFTVAEGLEVELDALQIGTRSSGGGPGRLALRWSMDDFASDLAVWDHAPNAFLNQVISLAGRGPVRDTVEFRIVAVGEVSASGGALSSTGTARVANYFAGGADTGWFGFTGTVREAGLEQAPVINSPLTASATIGMAFDYRITTTADGAPADSFSAGPLPAGLIFEPTEGRISGAPAEAGIFHITITATNAAGTDIQTLVLSVSAGEEDDGYNTWAADYGLTGEGALPDADPDGDGFSNVEEYAFGTDPMAATAALLTTTSSGGNLVVAWLERSDVTYNVQSTTNLATTAFANDGAVNVEAGAVEPAPPEGYTRKQFSAPATGSKFYRVTATTSQ